MDKVLEAGDIVKLNSGGPDMTIETIDSGIASVSWFNDNVFATARVKLTEKFPVVCLRRVEK